MKNNDIVKLKKRLHEISHLSGIAGLVSWDQEIMMPKKSEDARSEASAYLSSIIHSKFVSIDKDGLLTRLNKQLKKGELSTHDALIVIETDKSFKRESKFSPEFVFEMAELSSKAQAVWSRARKENNFKLFLPYFEKMVALKIKEAEIVGYKESPYDALLDTYEPGLVSSEASTILNDLKDFLVPFVAKIKKSKVKINKKVTKGHFPLESQKEFNRTLAEKLGFDFDSGRFDESTHPFTTSFHTTDVRITTRYSEGDALYAIGSTIHETGHGMYEQGLPSEYFGTPHAEYISLGIHESQSRFWEIGRAHV